MKKPNLMNVLIYVKEVKPNVLNNRYFVHWPEIKEQKEIINYKKLTNFLIQVDQKNSIKHNGYQEINKGEVKSKDSAYNESRFSDDGYTKDE